MDNEKQREQANEWNNILSSEYDENLVDRSKDKLLFGVHKGRDSRLKAKLISKLERDMPKSYAECYLCAPDEYSEYVSNKEALTKAAF
ncbi:protein Red [Nephila pilipes]|uniref:Protein Red n=1 Tax=Nephila pilipes TaxID=299642 RepID=A0A8X6QSR1_NEPPI|nr:protein Red [Nephila pilipes]